MGYVVVCCPRCGKARAAVEGTTNLHCPWCRYTFSMDKVMITARCNGMREAAAKVREINTNTIDKATISGVKTFEIEKSEEHEDFKDIEAIASKAMGVSGGKVEKFRFVVKALTELKGTFDVEDLIEVFKAMNVLGDLSEITELLDGLMAYGEIYEPEHGRYRYVE